MANFVESATLKIIDQASPKLARINSHLDKLASRKITISIDYRQAQRAAQVLKGLNTKVDESFKIHTKAAQKLAAIDRATARQRADDQIRVANAHAQNKQAIQAQAAQARLAAIQARAQAQAATQAAQAQARLTQAQTATTSPRNQAQARTRTQSRSALSPVANLLPSSNRLVTHGIGGVGSGFGFGNVVAAGLTGAALYQIGRYIATNTLKGVTDTSDVRAQLIQSGLTPQQTQARLNEAMQISRTPGLRSISGAQLAEASLEIANQALTARDASEQMKALARNAVILGTTFKDTEKGAQEARQLGRALNLMGKSLDPVQTRLFGDEAMRAIIAGGGDVTAGDFRRAMQQLKAEGLNLSPQAVGDVISMRDEGGRSVTADMRMFMNELTRTNLNKKDRALQTEAGFRDSSGRAITDAVTPFKQDPVSAVLNKFMPKLLKAGVDLDNSTEVIAGLQKMGLGAQASTFPARVITQRDQIMADRLARMRVDLDASLDPEKQSLRTKTASFTAQLQNQMSDVGSPVAQRAGKALDALTNSLATGTFDPAKQGQQIMEAFAPNLMQAIANPKDGPMAVAAFILQNAGGLLVSAANALISKFGLGDKSPVAPTAVQEKLAKEEMTPVKGISLFDSAKRNEIIARNKEIAEAKRVVDEYNTALDRKKVLEREEAALNKVPGATGHNILKQVDPERAARQKRIDEQRARDEKEAAIRGVQEKLKALDDMEKAAAVDRDFGLKKAGGDQNAADKVLETYANTLDKIKEVREKLEEIQKKQEPMLTKPGEFPLPPVNPNRLNPVNDPNSLTPAFSAGGELPQALQNFSATANAMPQALVAAGSETGASIAGGLQAQASAIGNSIGSAAASVLQGVTLNVTATAAPAANTGTQAPR